MSFSFEVQNWTKPSSGSYKRQSQLTGVTKRFLEALLEGNVRGLTLHHASITPHTTRLTVNFLKQKHI